MYFCLSILVISANLLVVVAVRYMRAAKKATIVFLCQLAVCNLVQGIIFLLKAFFFIWPVQVSRFLFFFYRIILKNYKKTITKLLHV